MRVRIVSFAVVTIVLALAACGRHEKQEIPEDDHTARLTVSAERSAATQHLARHPVVLKNRQAPHAGQHEPQSDAAARRTYMQTLTSQEWFQLHDTYNDRYAEEAPFMMVFHSARNALNPLTGVRYADTLLIRATCQEEISRAAVVKAENLKNLNDHDRALQTLELIPYDQSTRDGENFLIQRLDCEADILWKKYDYEGSIAKCLELAHLPLRFDHTQREEPHEPLETPIMSSHQLRALELAADRYLALGREEECIALFNEILALKPEQTDGFVDLHMTQASIEEALADLDEYREWNAGDVQYMEDQCIQAKAIRDLLGECHQKKFREHMALERTGEALRAAVIAYSNKMRYALAHYHSNIQKGVTQ